MIKLKLKMLGLAFVVMLAMSAMIASAAQATTLTAGNSTAVEHEHATLLTSQAKQNTFKFGIRELICSKAEFDGTLIGTDSTVEVTPTYSECSTKPVLGVIFRATVTHEGCTFLLHAAESFPKVTADVKCPAGKKITIHLYNNSDTTHSSPVCTLTVGETGNQGLGGSELENIAGSPDHVVLKTTEVPVTTDGTGSVCGGLDQVSRYNGENTIKAINTAGNQINLTAVDEA